MAKVAKDTRPIADQKTTETACTYAALILHDEEQEITATQIQKLLKVANIRVEPIWPKVFEKALKGKNVSDFFLGGPAPAGGAVAAPQQAAQQTTAQAPQEKKPEPAKVEEEEDVDMGGLFD